MRRLIAAALLALVVAGCGGGGEAAQPTTTTIDPDLDWHVCANGATDVLNAMAGGDFQGAMTLYGFESEEYQIGQDGYRAYVQLLYRNGQAAAGSAAQDAIAAGCDRLHGPTHG